MFYGVGEPVSECLPILMPRNFSSPRCQQLSGGNAGVFLAESPGNSDTGACKLGPNKDSEPE